MTEYIDVVKENGYAKINLSLDVLRRREDGYHEVCMLMQTLDLHDEVTLRRIPETGEIRLTLGGKCGDLEANEKNLAYRAAAKLFATAKERGIDVSDGVEISLVKNIPMAAGLAGGSADCAAVLVGMNRLFRFGFTQEELRAVGKTLGADVPYCIMKGTALAEGIGEKLTKLPDCPKMNVCLCKPGIDVSTAFAYGHLKINELKERPNTGAMIGDIENGRVKELAGRMVNVLESVTVPEHPVIDDIKKMMIAKGAINAMMSGSGPTVFGIFEDRETMEKAAFALREAFSDARVECTFSRNDFDD